jgi:hypothetical protein
MTNNSIYIYYFKGYISNGLFKEPGGFGNQANGNKKFHYLR